jgi:hypothetical protein
MIAAVAGVPAASAGGSDQPARRPNHSAGCRDYIAWMDCGRYVRASRLPLRFAYNPAGSPSGIGMPDAIRGAAGAWNVLWPSTQPPLTYAGGTTAIAGRDGVNVVAFGSPSWCGGGGDAVAIACIWFEGTTGERSNQIAEVDVLLNPAKTWRDPTAADLILGEVLGPQVFWAEPDPLGTGRWYDAQSVLTHELGHALGLSDIGTPGAPFPETAADAPKWPQTMYEYVYPRSTDKRTPHGGDVAALARAVYDSFTHD